MIPTYSNPSFQPGQRVIAAGKPGAIVTVPVYLPDGCCHVKYDHVPNLTDSYAGTLVRLSEVKLMNIQIPVRPLTSTGYHARHRKPLVWRQAAKIVQLPVRNPVERKAA